MAGYYDPMFCGTDRYYRYPIGNFLFADSVKYFCDDKEAWRTLDIVGSYMDKLKDYDFLVVAFDVEGSSATTSLSSSTRETTSWPQGRLASRRLTSSSS